MTFTPTAEQLACIQAASETDDNLLISALAGAAKTSTLVLMAEALPNVDILCLAFNKRIAEEMMKRLPPWVTSRTLNALGHRAWSDTIGRFCKLDTKKTYNNLKTLVDDLPAEDRKFAYSVFGDIMKSVAKGKSSGYIPDGHYEQKATPLMGDAEFRLTLDEEPSDLEWELIQKSTLMSLEQAFKGTIDFDDQILMPTIFSAVFPRHPVVMVDEAQDLSTLNHRMLSKLARKRLIAVGDECQAIYGFRGAHSSSMDAMEKQFNMKRLTLSISFRCPIAIIEAAQWRAPHMTWPDWAVRGDVKTLPTWSVDDIPESAAIICRNNAPLFEMAIRLLRDGRYPQLVGSDIGKSMTKTMKSLGPTTMSREAALRALTEWQEKKERRARDISKVQDQADAIRIFLNQGRTLGEAMAYVEHVLSQHGPIQLMTGHKSKGLEFDHVFILDKQLVRTEKHEQERNLLYVMITRSKETLTYVNSADYIGVNSSGD